MKMRSARSFFVLFFLVLFLASEAISQVPVRIRFARGRTSATVSGSVSKLGERTYVLGARSGQTLSANISSRNDCAKLGDGLTSFSIPTESGDNYIDVHNNCGVGVRFTLTVSIN